MAKSASSAADAVTSTEASPIPSQPGAFGGSVRSSGSGSPKVVEAEFEAKDEVDAEKAEEEHVTETRDMESSSSNKTSGRCCR